MPRYNPNRPDRQTTRLRGYDYSQPGAYFITICTHGRERLFGDVEKGRMRLGIFGRIVNERWRALPRHFPHVTLDAFVVMPNHVHGIVGIKPSREKTDSTLHGKGEPIRKGEASEPSDATQPFHGSGRIGTDAPAISDASPLRDATQPEPPQQPTGTTPGSLGAMVQNFKSTATRKINRYRSTPGRGVWQRGYHDRIIRNEREWHAVRRYIANNPARWEEDRNNPSGDE